MSDVKRVTRCPNCGSDDVVSISMNVEEAEVEFRACHRCEHRWWEQDGRSVSLQTVLARVNKR
jgi:DNA-directed RNA polymerase subunit M/transcription elongation factor TFIIS